MLWFTLSLLTAFFSATEAAFAKRWFGERDALTMTAYVLAYSSPLMLLPLLLAPAAPDPEFWITFFIVLPFNLAGTLLYLSAINLSPLSLTMPYLSVTPLGTLLAGMFFLGEFPDVWGLLGVLSVVGGGFVLNIEEKSAFSFLAPFKAIARERGSLYMLAAALIFGLTSALGKRMILQSSPAFACSVFTLAHNLILLALIFGSRKVKPSALLERPGKGALVGLFVFLHLAFHYWAVSLVAAAYMMSIKRLNGLFAVLYGRILFNEDNFRNRLLGAALMSVGVLFFTLAE
jgi:drug/metabolite transporter (DMT)-like permease